MPKLIPNIKNRVRKLPKPSNAAQAMQPVFEAISNALFAIEDRFDNSQDAEGNVTVRVWNLSRKPNDIRVEIDDDGFGLDELRYLAFQTIDTDFKIQKGGKGVGRLFWLDAFKDVRVESVYLEKGELKRSYFVLYSTTMSKSLRSHRQ